MGVYICQDGKCINGIWIKYITEIQDYTSSFNKAKVYEFHIHLANESNIFTESFTSLEEAKNHHSSAIEAMEQFYGYR